MQIHPLINIYVPFDVFFDPDHQTINIFLMNLWYLNLVKPEYTYIIYSGSENNDFENFIKNKQSEFLSSSLKKLNSIVINKDFFNIISPGNNFLTNIFIDYHNRIRNYTINSMELLNIEEAYGISSFYINSLKNIKKSQIIIFLDIDDTILLDKKYGNKINHKIVKCIKNIKENNTLFKIYFMTSRTNYTKKIKGYFEEILESMKEQEFVKQISKELSELNENNIFEKIEYISLLTNQIAIEQNNESIKTLIKLIKKTKNLLQDHSFEVCIYNALKELGIEITWHDASFRISEPEEDCKYQRMQSIIQSLELKEPTAAIFFDDQGDNIIKVATEQSLRPTPCPILPIHVVSPNMANQFNLKRLEKKLSSSASICTHPFSFHSSLRVAAPQEEHNQVRLGN